MGADRTETPTVDAQALFDVALDAIISITPEGRIVQFNASAERTFGHRREDVVGRRLSELIIPLHLREAHERGIARIAAGGPSTVAGGRLELPALHADGHELLVELTITPPQRETGVITAFLRDVTELRRTETALRVSEQDLRQIFDQAPTGMALVGVHEATMGTLLKVNAAMCALVGRDEPELLGTHVAAVTHPDDVAAFTAVLADTLAGNRPGYEVEKRFVRPDGTVVWAQINATLVRDAAGAPLHVIGLVQDVSERRRTQRELWEGRERLARTQTLARIGSWHLDLATRSFTWSDGVEHVFGRCGAGRGADATTFQGMLHPSDRESARARIDRALNEGTPQTWEFRVEDRDGAVFHMHAWGEVGVGDDGAPVSIAGYVQDVTDLRHAEELAANLRSENQEILDAAGDGIVRVDEAGIATFVNPAAEKLLGYRAGELVGRPLHERIHHSFADGTPHHAADCPIRRTAAGRTERVAEDVFWRRDGTPLPVAYTAAPVRVRGRTAGAVIVFSDVGERRRLEDQLREQAERDHLTGLYNRRRFEQALEERLASGRGRAALLLIDLDHFKFVNDSFGHAAGDDLLQVVARLLEGELRPQDVVCRLGGDEFGVLLPDADAGMARTVAGRLIAAIERSRPTGLHTSASVGATCFGARDRTTAGDLLVAADIALYESKDAGRGRVTLYNGRGSASLTWVERIRAALLDDRFVLHSQPIFDLATGRPVAEELLVRMLAEDGSLVPPGSFLPTAESFGIVADIDSWVLARGVERAAAGRHVHVNLSGHSLGRPERLDELAAALERTGADPRNLTIELTETAAVASIGQAAVFAERLRGLGCGLALDDFGTGFGSLTYLKHLPADYLKIDQEFVRTLAHSEADRRVVESVVDIARRFGQRTVAEGVEDAETLDRLRAAGVDFAQGYHLGRPAPEPRPAVAVARPA